jgi:hypothetical protein
MDVQRIMHAYMAIRAKRAELSKQDTELKEQQEKLSNAMLKLMQDQNVSSLRTDLGNVYKQEEITPACSDWDAFYRWVAENNTFEALERRIKKDFVKEYMASNEGALPPGVSVYREYVARVRKS